MWSGDGVCMNGRNKLFLQKIHHDYDTSRQSDVSA